MPRTHHRDRATGGLAAAPRGRVDGVGGWALVDALVATVVLASGSAVVASLLSRATIDVRASRDAAASLRLASQKLEELLSQPVSVPPGGALAADTPGFADRLDESGRVTATGVYVRRWLVEPTGAAPGRALRLVVAVHAVSQPGQAQVITGLRGR